MKIAIIVPCYNVERALDRCIQSLITQNYPKDKYHCFFINDASTDQTSKILESYKNHSELSIITHDVNKGLSATRNTGVNAGSADVICFLDGDMEVQHNWLKLFCSYLNQKNVSAVMGDNILPENSKCDEFENYYFSNLRGPRQFADGERMPAKYLLFGNTAVSRKIISEVGNFDESFKAYGGEDTDLAFRICMKYPESFLFSKKIYSIHYHPRTLDSFLTSMNSYGKNNLPLLLKKYPQFKRELAGDWIRSFKGYLIFNPVLRLFINIISSFISSYYLTRYKIVDTVISGARSKGNIKKSKKS